MLKSALRPLFDRFRERLLLGVVREEQLNRVYDQLCDQIAGMIQIQAALDGGITLKPMRRWALSPDAMAIILADLQERTRPEVVEFGSGQSTVIFAAWMRQHGGRLTTFEHDRAHADTVRRQLDACGLTSQVDLKVVPLVEHARDGRLPASKSYDLPRAVEVADVALVDGPPYWAGEATRFYPLKWAIDHLKKGGAVYLDDAARPPERLIIRELCDREPAVAAEELPAEKGLVRLTRKLAA